MTILKYIFLATLPAIWISCREKGSNQHGAPNREGNARSEFYKGKSTESDSDRLLSYTRQSKITTREDLEHIKGKYQLLDDASLMKLLESLSSSRNTNLDRRAFSLAIEELAKRHPEKALNYFPPETILDNESGLTSVILVLGQSSPELLEEWFLESLPKCSSGIRGRYANSIIEALARSDPRRALVLAEQDQDGCLDRGDVISQVFYYLAIEDSSAAVSLARQKYDGRDLDRALYTIAGNATNSSEGLEVAKQIKDPASRARIVSGILNQLASSDLSRVVASLNAMDSTTLNSVLISGSSDNELLSQLIRSNPSTATELFSRVPLSSSNEMLFKKAAKLLAESNFTLAQDFMNTVPEGPLKADFDGVEP